MSIVESYVNLFDCQEKELVNIMTSEVAENSIRDSLLASEENGVRAIEAFVAGKPNPFSKIKVVTKASSLMKCKEKKKKAFSCIQDELEVTRKILLACGSAPTRSLSVLRRLMPHELLSVSPALFERTCTGAGIWLRTDSKAALIDSIRMLSVIDSWPMNVTLRPETKAKIADVIFEIWKDQTENTPFPLVLAGGFSDRREVSVKGLPFDVCSELTESLASTHEEADTRLVLHVTHCFRRDYQQVIVKVNDTDILAMLIQHFEIMTSKCTASDSELYLKLRDKTFPIHQVVKKIPVPVTNTITFLHCFTGCDTVSFFYSKGKKTFFTAALKLVVSGLPSKHFRKIVIVAYGKQYEKFSSLDDLRVHLFHKKSSLKCLPPKENTFKYHVKRAAFQLSLMLQASEARPYIHNPLHFGWAYSHADGVVPITTTLLQWPSTVKGVPKSFSCRNGCAKRFPCSFDGKCDILCSCGGSCSIDSDEE
ncbi:hypothetical protein QYM36_019373 [Artemia franciscana]|uniref:Tesmin/TSO1-like CXC domain-containing protein n=1 Tax=Artemia franciscana TaxID=6661 RepID=A0AA88KTU4_ARTSF|nr:hypothetical protein QYM36_019373 [Artemia franciscana]